MAAQQKAQFVQRYGGRSGEVSAERRMMLGCGAPETRCLLCKWSGAEGGVEWRVGDQKGPSGIVV